MILPSMDHTNKICSNCTHHKLTSFHITYTCTQMYSVLFVLESLARKSRIMPSLPSSHHFHVVVRLEVYSGRGQHNSSWVSHQRSDSLSCHLYHCLLIQVLQPADVEGHLRVSSQHNGVQLEA